MDRILVTTDFSAASRHALDFTANLLQGRDAMIDLVHAFTVSVVATADALALSSIGAGIEHAEELMSAEQERIRTAWPQLQITGRVIAGNFLETIRGEALLVRPRFIVLGTAGFGDLYLGDTDPLEALRQLRYPVLFVPQSAEIRPIRQVAYACNYRFAGPKRTPLKAITEWTSWMQAQLSVVHTDKQARGEDPRQLEGERWLRENLAAANADFEWIMDKNVVHGLSNYLAGSDIDCVMAVPRRYGFWESLFHESRTKALARMNRLPVIAIHELGE
jgi:nucleotide-binding universal stress UspA family protein